MHKSHLEITLNKTQAWLLSEKALYFPEDQSLVIADWHLGKSSHFRKYGIFIPKVSLFKEFTALEDLIEKYEVQRVVFLGDLFHSEWNKDWDLFKEAIEKFFDIEFILTRGNHDIIDFEKYGIGEVKVVKHFVINNDIILSHEPLKSTLGYAVNVVGHTHPGVVLQTKSKQKFRLPCFYQEGKIFIIPAFGDLTGLYIMEKSDDNEIYVILGDEVRKLK